LISEQRSEATDRTGSRQRQQPGEDHPATLHLTLITSVGELIREAPWTV
jgi:hypothetical protein